MPFPTQNATGFREWIIAVRAEAVARGGKHWNKSALTAMGQEYQRDQHGERLYVQCRRPGEIANPVTGEVVTGCKSIGELAHSIGITSDQMTDEIEALSLVHRVLGYREVPMVIKPDFRKPRYFLTPEVTLRGMSDGLIIPIETHLSGGMVRTMILITPMGQQLLRSTRGLWEKPGRKIDQRRDRVALLIAAGHSQAAIARLTSLPKQTVSRHARAIQQAA